MRKFALPIMIALLCCALAAQEKPAQSPPKNNAPKVEKPANPSEVESPKPVVVDQEFLLAYTQLQALLTELNEIEAQTKAIRMRASTRNEQLRQWMTDHKIPPGWTYNAAKQQFEPPVERPRKE